MLSQGSLVSSGSRRCCGGGAAQRRGGRPRAGRLAAADSTQIVVAQIGSGSAVGRHQRHRLSVQAPAGVVNHLTVTIDRPPTARSLPTPASSSEAGRQRVRLHAERAHSFNCSPGYYDFIVGNLNDKNDSSSGANAHILVGAFYNGATTTSTAPMATTA